MKFPKPLLVHRYVISEFFPPFGVGLLVFTFILILHHLFLMMDLFLNRGVEVTMILRMVGLTLPMFFPLSVPMACLLGVLIAYGRLTEDGELTALRSGGCSLWQYSLPTLAVSLGFSLALVAMNLQIVPLATQEFKELYVSVAQKNPLALFAPKTMNQFGEYKVIVNSMDRRKKKLEGISIYKTNSIGAPTRILAPSGELESISGDGITLTLFNGSIHQPNPEKNNDYSITQFNRFAVRIPERSDEEERPLTPREMTSRQIWSVLRNETQSEAEIAALGKAETAALKTEFYYRIAIAFAPVALCLLGLALGIRFKKGSRSLGIGVSIVIVILYYGLSIFSLSISNQGQLPPPLTTAIPNIVTLGIGAYLFKRLLKQ